VKENELNLEEILRVFNENNIKSIIIGGQAAVAAGSPTGTYDIDFCYSRDKENLTRIVQALKPYHPVLRGADKGLPFIFDEKTLDMGLNFTFSTDIGDIDLFGEVTGLGSYKDVLKYSEMLQIYDMQCMVLNIEGLIKAKKAAGRKKDIELIIQLEALKEIRAKRDKGKE